MRLYRLPLLFCALLFLTCKKEDDDKNFTGHCNNLVNEALPTGDKSALFAVSAFSPNGDGINDRFSFWFVNSTSVYVKIYDSKGKLIVDNWAANINWQPPMPVKYEKYYYRIEAVSSSNHKIGICGEVYALSCYPPGKNKNSFSFEDQFTPNGFTGVTNEQLSNCN